MNDWYKILGITRNAEDAQVKTAYRKLAKKYHPDAHPGDKACEARFREITEAYTILSDPVKRKKYDEELSEGQKDHKDRKSRNISQQAGADTVNVDFRNISKNFEQFFGFNPNTKDVVNPEKLKSRARTDNPLDTTNLFETFMGMKAPGR